MWSDGVRRSGVCVSLPVIRSKAKSRTDTSAIVLLDYEATPRSAFSLGVPLPSSTHGPKAYTSTSQRSGRTPASSPEPFSPPRRIS